MQAVLAGVHAQGDPDLAQVAGAGRLLGPLPGTLKGGQEHGDEQGDNPDDHQQFNKVNPAIFWRSIKASGGTRRTRGPEFLCVMPTPAGRR